ncbi:MAG: GntR family transcriptional regulator [Comamonas sp.]
MAELNHTDVVRERILEKLIYAEYMPGHTFKLREMTESEEFQGMSQTPIREALLQLVAQDILMGQRGFSVRVPIPSVEHLAEVRAIRTKLEIMAATNAMHEWTPEGIAGLERIHAELQAAKAAGDVTRILRANVQFHFALYGAQRRSYLMTMIRTLWAITGPSIRFLYEEGRALDTSGRHPHADVIEALRRQDRAMLEKAIADDMSETGRKILQVLREKVSPEALAVQPFGKMELLRTRAKQGRKIQRED